MKHVEVMKKFSTKNIPNLDVCVLAALELFSSTKIPKFKLPYKYPLVVGSGNAEATGRILFNDKEAVFASESDVKQKLKTNKHIDGVVLVSASGSKHAPIIAKLAKRQGKHVTLITNNPDAPAEKFLDHQHSYDEYIYPKNREPYTYNTSTYLGMILGKTKENPKKILQYINNQIDKIKLPNFKTYDKYYLIIPPKFSGMKRMLQVKFIELFGRQIARDVETSEYIKHATTVVPSKELFISFGEKNTTYGKNRLHIPLPKWGDYGSMMAISYYVIGKIQAKKQDYFKHNLVRYCKEASKIFGDEIKPIVE